MDSDDIGKHEAAHAITAWAGGARLIYLTTIGPRTDDGIFAYCKARPPEKDPETLTDWYMAPAVLSAQTGGIDFACLNDIFELMKSVAWAGDLAVDAVCLLRKHGDDWQQAALDFLDLHSERVSAFVGRPDVAKIIGLLSQELNRRGGKMSGFEVANFLEQSWGGPTPPKALPAEQHFPDVAPSNSLSDALKKVQMHLDLALQALERVRDNEDGANRARAALLQSVFALSEMEVKNR